MTGSRLAVDNPAAPRQWTGRRALGETIIVSGSLALLTVVTGVLTARLLGPEGRGALALAIVVSTLVSAAIAPGLAQAFSVLVAERSERARLAVSLAVWSGLSIGLSVTVVGWLVTPVLLRDFETARNVQIGLLAIPVTVAGVCVAGVLRGMMLGRRYNVSRLVAPVLYCIGIVLLAVLDRITVVATLAAYVTALTASAAAAYALVPRSLRSIQRVPLGFVRLTYRYGAAASLSGVASVVKLQLALLVLAATTDAREVGFYAVAISYAVPVGIIASAISIHTLPDVAAADRAVRAELVRRRLHGNAASLLVIGGLSVLAAPFVIPVAFGQAFVPAVGVAQLLVVAQAASAVTLLQAEVCRALVRPGLASAADGLGIIATVALLLVITPSFAGLGAACVAVAVNTAVAIGLGHRLNRELDRLPTDGQ